MCYDDFDFDDYDGIDDPDNDFQDDMFNEFEPEADELDMEAEFEEPVTNEPGDPEPTFDFQDAFILGGMIVGQAYEEAQDEKENATKKDEIK